jgi:hypothetical protein
VLPPPYQVEKAVPPDTARHQPVFTGRPAPASRPVPVRVAFPEGMAQDAPAAAHPGSQAQPIRVAAAGDPKAEEADWRFVLAMGRRTPHTDIVLPPSEEDSVTQGAAAGARRLPCG